MQLGVDQRSGSPLSSRITDPLLVLNIDRDILTVAMTTQTEILAILAHCPRLLVMCGR
jgi:hypothetical protein